MFNKIFPIVDNSWYNISNEEYSNNNEDSISDIKMNKGQNVDNDAFMRNIEDDMYNTEDDKYTKDIDDIQNMNDNEYVEINELKKGTD
ncbi:uncharacterized protein OCT59_016541 [Rhizophagus irregularis]|uniref:uncharacterized protein n=1 Tax=Rhizophagus irregularis TaxID=588596 RepID=UPI000CBEAFB9|nr:hypothetical protein OCT59_016541 [Rhizophagus irregularis]GBC15227.1 hypothetical protein RIR_jg10328.t1 [Rhizophagus irregularis DAOM 181602=DAOM 197198]